MANIVKIPLEDGTFFEVKDTDTDLDLSKSKITELPASIGNLTALRSLSLAYSQITELPESIDNLTALESGPTTEVTLYLCTQEPFDCC